MAKNSKTIRLIHYIYGLFFVRPRRWFFWKMIANTQLRLLPEKNWYTEGWNLPNIHWWIFYNTIFKFFSWLYWDAWRSFCKWENGWRSTYPFVARTIHRIGATTAGYAIHGGECYNCASPEGCPSELSDDETGIMFKLEREWSESSMNGIDYRFCGTTVCPKCGYEDYYEDGSL